MKSSSLTYHRLLSSMGRQRFCIGNDNLLNDYNSKAKFLETTFSQKNPFVLELDFNLESGNDKYCNQNCIYHRS